MANGAYFDTDRGYDLSLFESDGNAARKKKAAPHKAHTKKNNVIELNVPEYDKSQRRKYNVKLIAGVLACTIVFTLCIGFIIRGRVELTELNQEIATAQVDLERAQSRYTEVKTRMESSLSTAAIAKYAQENLGMSKATAQQKEYISLSEGDKAEVYIEKKSNVFERIGDFFGSLWS